MATTIDTWHPISWQALFLYISGLDNDTMIVSRDGWKQFPDEWCFDRRHYTPSPTERYHVTRYGIELLDGEGNPSGRGWRFEAASQMPYLEAGTAQGLRWTLDGYDRLTFETPAGARMVFRLMPWRGGLEAAMVYLGAGWSMEATSTAAQMADRLAQRIARERAEHHAA